MADDDLPIDIHYDKLVDWLVDRKKISKDWRKKLAVVHGTLSELARGLPGSLTRASGVCVPDSSITDTPGEPTKWDYYRAVLIRDKIVQGADLTKDDEVPDDATGDENASSDNPTKTPDPKPANPQPTRSLFGRLAGSAKQWDDIVRLYEKDALHLPESGLTLVKVTDYDVPYIQNQSQKLVKQLSDLDRREQDLKRSASVAHKKFLEKCQEVGVSTDSKDFSRSVMEKLVGLDDVFDKAVAAMKSDEIGDSAAHYAQWTQWAHNDAIVSFENLLPSLWKLRSLSSASDVDAVLRSTGEGADGNYNSPADAPGIVQPPSGGIDWDVGGGAVDTVGVVPPPSGGIDWDLGGAVETVVAPAGGIDWDLGGGDVGVEETGGTPSDVVEIKWDVGDVVEIDTDGIGVDETGAGDGISFDLDISADIVVENVGGGEDVADSRDSEIQVEHKVNKETTTSSIGKVLSSRTFRGQVIDDLLELNSFLTQRAFDASSSEATSLLSTVPAELKTSFMLSPEELRASASHCVVAVELLSTSDVTRLLLVSSSATYRQRVAHDLLTASQMERKFLDQVNDVEKKIIETRRNLKRESMRLESVKKSSAEVKAFVEKTIGAMYKGRVVHIIGEVNKALSS